MADRLSAGRRDSPERRAPFSGHKAETEAPAAPEKLMEKVMSEDEKVLTEEAEEKAEQAEEQAEEAEE